jgi:O-acetyl-ADP-ribose deacetylase (regulator of RNase III)
MNQVVTEHLFPSGVRLQLVQGDITAESVDAIVNAANPHLAHGAGVAGAILQAGGAVIQEESRQWVREHGPVTNDEPAYTRAGELPCRYVIHAVGPVWGEGDEDAKLRSAIRGSLRLAERLGLESIAIPAISTGIYGFPRDRAARVILSAIMDYLVSSPESKMAVVRVVLYDQAAVQAFLEAWEQDDHLSA